MIMNIRGRFGSFNPSFLLDGLGIFWIYNGYDWVQSFNPSFLLDGLGIRRVSYQALPPWMFQS